MKTGILLLGGLGLFGAWKLYEIGRGVSETLQAGALAANYLFTQMGQTTEGQAVNRAALLDQMVTQAAASKAPCADCQDPKA